MEELKFVSQCVPGRIWPACFPSPGLDYSLWVDTWVTGWGRTEATAIGSISTVLQDAQVAPVSWQGCRLVMGETRVTEGMICAGAEGKDTCNGDSGGPMVTRHESTGGYSVIGITSWGDVPCAKPQSFGVYANVAHYLDWIAEQVGYSGIGPVSLP